MQYHLDRLRAAPRLVLTAALSGANAALYVSSRMLFSLARSGWAPARLGKLNSVGSPRLALLVSSFGIVVAFTMLLVLGYTVPILGALVRYRSLYIPFLLIPMMAGTDWRKLQFDLKDKLGLK